MRHIDTPDYCRRTNYEGKMVHGIESCSTMPFKGTRILYDTLIGYEIPAFRKEIKRKIIQAPRFYYFDVGLANYLMGLTPLLANLVSKS
jgi:hypothetical protein